MSLWSERSRSTEEPSSSTGQRRNADPLNATLHAVANAARSVAAAIVEQQRHARIVVASVGRALDESGLRLADEALQRRESLWIEDASPAIAVLPLSRTNERSARALVLVRTDAGAWTRPTRAAIETFLPIVESLLATGAAEREHDRPREVLQAVIDSLTDFAWIKDAFTRYIAVNRQAAAVLEREPDEMIGKTDDEFFSPDIAENHHNRDHRVLRDGAPVRTMDSFKTPEGKRRWVETIKTPARDTEGNVIGVIGIGRDVTAQFDFYAERRRLTQELAEQRDRLSDMIANVPGVVWEERFDGEHRFVSQHIVAFLGYGLDEFLRTFRSFHDAALEEDRPALERDWEQMIATRSGASHTFRMRRKDGSIIWTESHCRVILDDVGMVTGVRGVWIDITARKTAEDRLRASEAHFRQLANTTPMMIWTASVEGASEFQNRAILEFVGGDPDALSGTKWVHCLHPDDIALSLEKMREAAERKTAVEFEVRARRHDGEYRQLLVHANPRFAADGSVAGFIGTNIDLTDIRSLEHRLEEERRLTSLGHLAATIAHEINNVLMAIQPFADVIRRSPSPALLDRAADHITDSVRRGRRITHEILRFANATEPVCEPFDVQEWLEDIAEQLRNVLGGGVELVIEPGDAVRMFGDRHQLTQVMTNLAANARDAMSGHGTLRVVYRHENSWPRLPAGEFVHLIVADSGTGIPPAVAAHVFEPLFTTKPTGTGLGLAIVRDVVRRHHGDVVVENACEGGAVFHILIPATADVAPMHVPAAASLPKSIKRILLIEDDEVVAQGTTALLQLEGATVSVATRGENAVAAIAEFHPDLVVLDIGLPDIDGTVVFARIRAIDSDLPVIFSTGHARELEALAPSGGPTAHLLKPYDITTLLTTIRELVGSNTNE